MDRALLRLMTLRLRGAVRGMFRGLRTVRGAVFFALGAVVFGLWLGPAVVMSTVDTQRTDPAAVREVVPLILLGMCLLTVLTSGKQKSVYFSPAEVDFLFAGPFSRRQLLAYKIASGAAGSLLSALFFSLLFLRHASFWAAGMVGCLAALVFVQLFSTAVLLVGQTVTEHVYTHARRLVLLGVLTLLALALAPVMSTAADSGLMETARALRQSTVGFWLLAPFEVFGRTLTAERIVPGLLVWGGLAACVDLALLGLVMWLDVNYLEVSLAVSEQIYRRRLQARRRGSAWVVQSKAAWGLPRLPWLGGAGPIAHRQLTTALRSARGFLLFFLVMGALAAVAGLSRQEIESAGLVAIGTQIVMLTIIFARMLPFDFRGDLDCMDWLKSLPLRPTALAAGQLVAPTVVLCAMHLVILGLLIALVRDGAAALLVAAAFTLPFNFLLFGVENLLFLLFPTRSAPASPGDLQRIGRTMVELLAKVVVLAACCGLAAAFGALVSWMGGGSQVVFAVASWLALALAACAVVPCVAWAFGKFDVSVDTPP